MRFALLTSAILTLSAPAFAHVEFSGFAYYTHFTDQEWFEDDYKAAVNIDYTIKDFAIRGQITTQNDQPRRLIFEHNMKANRNTAITSQMGRLVRIDGFYNNLTDSPSVSGMSVLPVGVYNRRMNTGTFSIIDGIQVIGRTNHIVTMYEYGFRLGKPFIDSETELQKEVFNGFSSSEIESDVSYNNFDMFVRWQTKAIEHLASYNRYVAKFVPVGNSEFGKSFVQDVGSEIIHETFKIGAAQKYGKIRYSGEYKFASYELVNGNNHSTVRGKTHAGYIKAERDLNEYFNAYAIRLYGRTETTEKTSSGYTLGLTYDNGDWMSNVEWHKGSASDIGTAKHGSSLKDWNLLAISFAKRF